MSELSAYHDAMIAVRQVFGTLTPREAKIAAAAARASNVAAHREVGDLAAERARVAAAYHLTDLS